MLKMKELMLLSNESKSTILYYVKEGLLPQPHKPKPNLHLYDENCIRILKFIKYLQNNFSYTISQIQHIFKNNNFEFDGSFDMMVKSLELISGGKDSVTYQKDDFLELVDLNDENIDSFIQKGYLLKNNDFTSKDVEIVEILNRAKKLNFDFKLLDEYVNIAKQIAKKENDVGETLLSDNDKSHDERYEFLFDLILKLKPYIFNAYTVNEHKIKIQKRKTI